ncbi:hypothetical protein [Angustibacter aerolatus]
MRRLPDRLAAAAFLVAWVGVLTALQWSVVRFRLAIVLVLTSAAVLLTTALVRRWTPPPLPRPLLAAALLAGAVVTEVVPFFSHASPGDRRLLAHVAAGTGVLLAAALLGLGRRAEPVALGVAAVGVVAWTTAATVVSPHPAIDVWVTLQQAADGMLHGQNPYAMTWTGSPGIQDAFTYLPWTAVLLAPGRWLAGDVRWALLVWLLVALACTVALDRGRPASGRAAAGRSGVVGGGVAAALLVALAPGSVTQAEQAWTEPLLLACLAGWALLVRRGHAWWAVVPLALGVASKQHLVLLAPLLAVWPAFGWRRVLATGGLAGVLVAPWFLASPADMWHDTVTLLVGFHPIRFANTLYLAALTDLGWTPPFWLTGLAVLGALGGACLAVHRRRPGLGELLGWMALVLLVANLVNKQAFYNQYWLCLALVALAVAAGGPEAWSEPEVAAADEPVGVSSSS